MSNLKIILGTQHDLGMQELPEKLGFENSDYYGQKELLFLTSDN